MMVENYLSLHVCCKKIVFVTFVVVKKNTRCPYMQLHNSLSAVLSKGLLSLSSKIVKILLVSLNKEIESERWHLLTRTLVEQGTVIRSSDKNR